MSKSVICRVSCNALVSCTNVLVVVSSVHLGGLITVWLQVLANVLILQFEYVKFLRTGKVNHKSLLICDSYSMQYFVEGARFYGISNVTTKIPALVSKRSDILVCSEYIFFMISVFIER